MAESISPGENQSQEPSLVNQLRQLIQAIQASGKAILPRTNDALLLSIAESAARIFGAKAASIALLNEENGTLEFKVAVGQGNTEVVGKNIPINKGIAGYVAMTGQPIAVSNVEKDPRFAQDFAQSTGYVPNSILATPLLSNDRVIGVMEVLDKIDTDSFGLQDMELLGIFAQQAALAIDQSQHFDRLGEALVLGLKRLATEDPTVEAAALSDALEGVNTAQLQAGDLLTIADLFNQVSKLGAAEQQVCLKILATFAEYGSTKTKLSGGGSYR
jgi:GAF domain-containing protein